MPYFVIREPDGGRNRSPLDIPGVILSTLGLVALVYGFTRAESDGWSDARDHRPVRRRRPCCCVAFVIVEAKVKAPLLPLRVVTDRNRGGVYLSLGLAIIAMFGLFLFLTYYLQVVKGYSPVKTGFAFLPMVAGMITGSTQIGARLMTRVPARLLMGPGFLVAAAGMLLLTQLEVDRSYAGLVLPADAAARPRHGYGVHARHVPGHARRRAAGRRCRLRDGQHLAAGGRRHRHRPAEHHRRLRHGLVHQDHIATAATKPQQQLVQLQGMVHGYTNAAWFAVGIVAGAAVIALALINVGRPKADSSTGEGLEAQVPVIAH